MASAKKGKAKAQKSAKAKPSKAKVVKAKPVKTPARKAVAKPVAKSAKAPVRARSTASAGDAIRALARRIVAVTVANDDEGALALYAPHIESTEAGQPPARGIEGIRAKFEGWRQFATAAQFEARRVCVDGNTIVIEWMGRVTLAGSGKQVDMHEVAVHEIEGGKIAREAFFYNPAALA